MNIKRNDQEGTIKSSASRRVILPSLSVLLLAVHSALFIIRPDFAALWTIFPFWTFAVPALLLTFWCGARGRPGRRLRATLFLCWVAAALLLSDESRGILRWGTGDISSQPLQGDLRVISLNCSVGAPEAANEVTPLNPSVVLLQESPSREVVASLTKRLWGEEGGFVWGVDGTVLARGKVAPITLPANMAVFATAARVKTAKESFVAASFRLTTPPFRVDVWSPSAWQALAAHRSVQRAQLQALMNFLNTLPGDTSIIIGGDCNAPGGDAIFRVLRPRLTDAYREGGRGWCNTFQDGFPILRIDQLWYSRDWRAATLVVRHTPHSDHYLVVCDFEPRD